MISNKNYYDRVAANIPTSDDGGRSGWTIDYNEAYKKQTASLKPLAI